MAIKIKDPYSLISSTVSGLGDILDSADEQRMRNEAGRMDLADYVVGNTWGDIFNNSDRLSQGLDIIQDSQTDYSNIKNNTNLLNSWDPNDLQDTVTYAGPTTSVWGDVLGDAGKAAAVGSTIAPGIGTLIGAGVGAVSGIVRGAIGDIMNRKNAAKFNQAINKVNQEQVNNFYDTAMNNQQRQQRQAMMNYFAEGGSLEELNKVRYLELPKHSFADGGDTGNGITVFRGLKHGQFGLEGIPQGIASDGIPNYAQGGGFDKNGNPLKGEIKYKDYIYGKLKITKELADKYHLPEKWVGLKYQEAADDAQKESEVRPNDPVSISTLDSWMDRLKAAQEEARALNAMRRAAKIFSGRSDEEKMGILAMMQGEEQPIMADGGEIRIKKSKRGTFTAAAKKHGKSVQEFASQVLAHPENYSEVMRKKAQFARNAAKWHELGGHLFDVGGNPQYTFNDADLAMMVGGLGIRPTTTAVETPNGSIMLANPVLPEADLNSAINSAYEREFGSMSEEQVDRALGQNSTTSTNSNLRFAPAVGSFLGMLQSALQPRDYTLANQLRDIASQYTPLSAPSIGGYRRYIPYDVNLGDAENLALQASALRSSRGQNRATQAAINAALINKFQETSAKRNLAAQEANEQRRAAIDAYNLGIDKTNASLQQAYDQLNSNIKDKRLGLLSTAAQAQDASDTAWSNSLSTTTQNFFNQLGRVGEDQWAYEQFMKLFPYLKS